MSELFVVAFNNEFGADEALLDMSKNAKVPRFNLEYAAIAIRKADGQVLIKQTHPLNYSHTTAGSFWGLLIGILLLNPIAGLVAGGVAGTMAGTLKHIGIDDAFIKSLGEMAQPGTSILFVIEHEATPGTVLHELKNYDCKLLRTSFGYASEEKLRKALMAQSVQESK